MTGQQTDPAVASVEEIKHHHRQHVSVNFPEPGICVSRCADRWPCQAYRAASAVEAGLNLHRKTSGHAWCESCRLDTGEPVDWPCSEYLAILAALTGTSVVAITAREMAEHKASCQLCRLTPPCNRQRELAARWRRALREAGNQQ